MTTDGINITDEVLIPETGKTRIRSHWSHAYYVKVGMTDVDKMRSDATRDAAGDQYNVGGVCSIIHHHRLLNTDNESTISCKGYGHEMFHKEGCMHGDEG